MRRKKYKAAFEKYTHLLSSELTEKYGGREFEFSKQFDLRMEKLFESPKKSPAHSFGWYKLAAAVCVVAIVISLLHFGRWSGEQNELPRVEYDAISYEELRVVNSSDIPCNMYYTNLEILYNAADKVVFARVTDDFFEAEQVLLDKYNNPAHSFEEASLAHSCTKRSFQVEKVYKGGKITGGTVREKLITDGKSIVCYEDDFYMKKDEKYILFLFETEKENEYTTALFSGKYGVSKPTDQPLYQEVKEKFKEDF